MKFLIEFQCLYQTDGSFGWVAKGAALEVFSLRTAERLAAWHFGVATHEASCTINSVCEFGKGPETRQLIVGTSSGLVCLFDVNVSAVLRVIRLSFNVSWIAVVNSLLMFRISFSWQKMIS